MTSFPRLTAVATEFLSWAADDYTEVFALRDILRRVRGALPGEAEREAVLSVIRELLEADLVRVGEMRRDTEGLYYWDMPVSNLLARLEDDWGSAWPPGMGEGPWFYATDKGKQLVEADH